MSQMLNSIFSNPDANPTSKGECAGCVACCVGCNIPDGVPERLPDGTPNFRNMIPKAPGTPCWWLNTSGPQESWGCGIYNERPIPCRTYKCWALELLANGKRKVLVQAYDVLRENGVDGRRQVYRSVSKEADRVKAHSSKPE